MDEKALYRLQLSDIRIFLEAARTGNFTETARMFHIGQPVVSKRIQALEGELSLTLFVRNGKRIEITPAGRMLADRLGRIYADVSDAVRSASQVQEGVKKTFTMGFCDWDNLDFINDILAYQKANPNVAIEVENQSHKTLHQRLWNGSVDVVIVNEYSALAYPDDRFMQRLIGSVPCYVYVSDDNPIAQKDEVRFDDLRDQPLIVPSFDLSPGYYSFLNDLTQRAGFAPNIAQSGNNMGGFLWHIALGEGLYITSSKFANVRHYSNVRMLRLTDMDTRQYAIWKNGADTSAFTGLLDYLTKAAD